MAAKILTWANFKADVLDKGYDFYEEDDGSFYHLYTEAYGMEFRTSIDYPGTDATDYENNYQADAGKPEKRGKLKHWRVKSTIPATSTSVMFSYTVPANKRLKVMHYKIYGAKGPCILRLEIDTGGGFTKLDDVASPQAWDSRVCNREQVPHIYKAGDIIRVVGDNKHGSLQIVFIQLTAREV